ncbi:MAG: peptide-N-glycosidase F-related protein [Polyangiaceae bacterium]
MERWRISLAGLFVVAGLVACGGTGGTGAAGGAAAGGAGGAAPAGGSSAGGAGGAPLQPGTDAVVTPFDKTPVYFTGDDNQRMVDLDATFPADGLYSKIVLHLSLDCPAGGCDPWDRFGSLGVVTQKGATPDQDQVIEIARFITPYHVAGTWDFDVTDLRPLLSGPVTLQVFIDTWVGPGSPYGDGWLFSASFEMTGGIPEKIPVSVTPVWPRTYVPYGDPLKPIATSAPAEEVALPAATSYSIYTWVTGHGQGNAGNCAEFCSRDHTLTVGGTDHAATIWRDDCATTAVPNQQGTWKYSRAGWCPGADVHPWITDVTADANGKSTLPVAYNVEDYENTCRPDAQTCQGCTLGTGCDYDGGAHTEPNYQLSALLVGFK